MKVLFSPLARADLGEIKAFIAKDNPARARTFVLELRTKAMAIASNPTASAEQAHLAPGLRRSKHGRYDIYYSLADNTLYIERIIHSARDKAKLFPRR